MTRLTPSKDCAIALTGILRDFKESGKPTRDVMYMCMKTHGHGTHAQATAIVKDLRKKGIIENHGKGNKVHFPVPFNTMHYLEVLKKQNIV